MPAPQRSRSPGPDSITQTAAIYGGSTAYNYYYDHHNRLTTVKDSSGTTQKAAFTYDALGRRIRAVNNVVGADVLYYYDGVNEVVEADGENWLRFFVHGISYIDERLMMMQLNHPSASSDDRPYYYTIDRMYNVRYLLDRAGAIVESYAYDPYGKPLIRECAGRGDMTGNSVIDESGNNNMFTRALNCQTFDPRADMNDDGDVDSNDQSLYNAKKAIWTGSAPSVVKTARSLVGNPFMFQGRPHFALATEVEAEDAELMLNDHRNRFADPMTGRWLTRDPLHYRSVDTSDPGIRLTVNDMPQPVGDDNIAALFELLGSSPHVYSDPSGLYKCLSSCYQYCGAFWAYCLNCSGDRESACKATGDDACHANLNTCLKSCASGKKGSYNPRNPITIAGGCKFSPPDQNGRFPGRGNGANVTIPQAPPWLDVFLTAIGTGVPFSEALGATTAAPAMAIIKLCNDVSSYIESQGNVENWDDPELVRRWMNCKRAGGEPGQNPPPGYWDCKRVR